jgi:hypothetical protein
MSRNRRLASFSRHHSSRCRTVPGVDGGSWSQLGACDTTAAKVSVTVARPNAAWPVSISYNTQPNAQMSARESTACPRACSGLM